MPASGIRCRAQVLAPSPTPVILRAVALGLAALVVAACDVTVGAAKYSVREEKTFTVTGGATLSLTTWDGSIEVRGWDRNEVRIEIEKRGPDQATVDRIQVKASQSGNAITLEILKPSPLVTTGLRRSPSASVVVSAPLQSTVTARSGDGSLAVRRITGKVDLDTDDGSVHIEEVKGDLIVRTGDGSVEAQRLEGTATVTSGDGSIGVDGVLTGLQAETHDGSVKVTARAGSAIATPDWSVTTGDGSIRIELPDGFGAEVDAESGDGRVQVDKMAGKDPAPAAHEDGGRGRARGTIGAGGKPLRLRTGAGTISVTTW